MILERLCPWDDCLYPLCSVAMGCPDAGQVVLQARIAMSDVRRRLIGALLVRAGHVDTEIYDPGRGWLRWDYGKRGWV